MIISRIKNQKMARDTIFDFIKENPNFAVTLVAKELELTKFIKFLAQRMLKRAEDEDCYTIDMIEDLERLE